MSAVVDCNRRFLDIDVKWPESVGDNRVFSNSTVGRLYEEYFAVAGVEEGAGLLPSGWAEYQKIPFFLLADAAYASSRYLVTMYEIAETLSDVVVSELNRNLAGMRYPVECAFGVLKSRWRALSRPIEIAKSSLHDMPTLVSAICILHNLVIDERNGIWDAEADKQRKTFHMANYLAWTNELTCTRNRQDEDKTRIVILEWMSYRDSVRSS
ncbi:Nuclease HARBI1 [Phytophthora megakarya]|uniref:Nuclease HARBI1 n=1 Tax=Phytophthora megakarya TaxID=4795 RepID=A0A225VLT2_9STRA|nr:Nuclease HARBI1 [Phytophthora megakarya]